MATITGTPGSDTLNATAANDVLEGLQGEDVLNAGGFAGVVAHGGADVDTLRANYSASTTAVTMTTAGTSLIEFAGYPAPGGTSVVGSGAAGNAGGRTVTYTLADTPPYSSLWWGPVVGAAMDGNIDPAEIMTNVVISGGGTIATWTGQTSVTTMSGTQTVYVRFTATIQNGTGSWQYDDDVILSANGPTAFALLNGPSFQLNYAFTASLTQNGTYTAFNTLYDSLATTGSNTRTSVNGMFAYTDTSTRGTIQNGGGTLVTYDHIEKFDITGGTVGDTLVGGAYDDRLIGMGGNDILIGNGGNDLFDGGDGDDTMTGGSGQDFFFIGSGTDTVNGGGGVDLIYAGANLTPGDIINGGASNDILGLQGNYSNYTFSATNLVSIEILAILSGSFTTYSGGSVNDRHNYHLTTIDANVAAGQILPVNASQLLSNERLYFNGSAETDGSFFFYGGAGEDRLIGGAQADIFAPGAGQDVITGGGGNDIFYYRFVNESPANARDYITDFTAGDRLNIAAFGALAGNPPLSFIGGASFSNVAGQVRINGSGTSWEVQIDIDGDGNADFAVAITTTVSGYVWSTADFVM